MTTKQGLIERLLGLFRPTPAPPPAGGADAASVREVLGGWIEANRRTSWRPQVAERDGAPDASRFGGHPWLAPGEPWPTCTGCGKPLTPFVQFDLGSLPGGPDRHGQGLLQLFYCIGDNCPAEAWAPFEGGKLVRVVTPVPSDSRPPPEGVVLMPAREIVGWEPREDWPTWVEHEDVGLDVEWLKNPRRVRLTWRERGASVEVGDDSVFEEVLPNASGDKLGGWPAWVQGVEYPTCPKCGDRMEFLFQVDSEDHVPWMFGDTGCGHITRCPNHPEVVAFGWACA